MGFGFHQKFFYRIGCFRSPPSPPCLLWKRPWSRGEKFSFPFGNLSNVPPCWGQVIIAPPFRKKIRLVSPQKYKMKSYTQSAKKTGPLFVGKKFGNPLIKKTLPKKKRFFGSPSLSPKKFWTFNFFFFWESRLPTLAKKGERERKE